MTELFDLNEEMPKGFVELISANGRDAFRTGRSVALGIADEGEPAGAIVAFPTDDGTATIESLYINPVYRRKGYASELLIEAINALYNYDNILSIDADIVVNGREEPGTFEFFEAFDFDLEEDPVHGALSFILEDAAKSEKVKGEIDKRVIPFGEALRTSRNKILSEHTMLQRLVAANALDEEVSCIIERDDEDKLPSSCLILGVEYNELIVAWAEAAEGTLDLVNMLRFAVVEALKKYGPKQKIRVPYINEHSKSIILKLMGDKAEPSETVWNAHLELEYEFDGTLDDELLEEG
ncbi:MAG: GNAT family N-acetyltransferase [Lachnospiraceae bacterium]|nr:GNAT family N-acetyltransferase [Lachnospiraceae bacterium]